MKTTKVLSQKIFWTTFLSCIFIRKSTTLPLLDMGPLTKATENRPLLSNRGYEREAKEDIFDIILRANSARKTTLSSGFGKLESVPLNEDVDLFQGDIVMTEDIRKALKDSHTDVMTLPPRGKNARRRQRRAVTADVQDKWPIVNGRVEVPYVIEASSVPNKALIIQAMDHWHANVPCITFVPRTNQPDYLSFFSGQGCFSWTGRTGGKQRISIGPACLVMGVIAHEIGHALGFWHEQSRPDRDNYVKILWNNIESGKMDEFKMISNADTNDLGVPYDLASLMHYGPKAFSKSSSLNTIESLDGSTNFGQRNGLSNKDIEQARLLYCPGTNVCQTLYSDLNASCSSWSALDHCDHKDYKNYMNINCKKSCLCKVCEDKSSSCGAYVTAGYCTNDKYKDYMALNCRKGCGLCK